MKKLIIIMMLSISTVFAFANNNSIESLIKCLGNEEGKIHKNRIGGAIYELNQRLISELIMFQKINIDPQVKNHVCNNKKYSSSVLLLEQLISMGPSMFSIPSEVGELDREFYMSSVHEFFDLIPEIFFLYVGQLQAATSKHDCLEKNIPELKKLIFDMKALEQDIPAKKLIRQDRRGEIIMKKLRKFSKIEETCRKEVEKEKADKKKKLQNNR